MTTYFKLAHPHVGCSSSQLAVATQFFANFLLFLKIFVALLLTILTTSSSFLWGWFSDAKHVKVFTILFFKIFEPINTLCTPKQYNFFGCKKYTNVLNEMPCQSVGFHYSCTTKLKGAIKIRFGLFSTTITTSNSKEALLNLYQAWGI